MLFEKVYSSDPDSLLQWVRIGSFPPSDGERVGIPLASDDVTALDVAEMLVREAGFDPVIVGPLARGKEFEPDTPTYNTGMSGSQLRRVFQPA